MKMYRSMVDLALSVGALLFSAGVLAKGKKPKLKSKDYSVGKATQDVTPKELRETTRTDGSKSFVTGKLRNAKGKIIGPHTHSVVRNGVIVFSRTRGGKHVVDINEKSK